jgi:hypothetical protein
MSNITDMFSGLLSSNIDQIQNSLGDNDKKGILSAASVALPAMLEALNKNTNTKEGAESLATALDKDHDGSKLNDISSMIGNYKNENGAAILNHMFGDKKENVINSVSKSSGLNTGSTINLMSMLAPLVLEFLGKTKKEQNLDADGISNFTSIASNLLGSSNGNLMGMLTNLLDSDKDGSIMDDAMDLIGGFFKK